jgi:putative cell wall-binding protein
VGTSGVSDPRRIAVSLDGTIYLADTGYEIKTWDWFGTFGGSWTTLGVHTMGLGLAHDGNVYTTTDNTSGITHSVIKYDRHGDLLASWGGYGTDPGLFRRPYDVEVDPLERSYVIEAEGARAQVFEPDGTRLATFGTPGAGDGQFQSPYGIAVGPNRTVYVADAFNQRVSKWSVTASTVAAGVAGNTRYTTAVAASQKAYPGTADIVVLATGTNWPDALGGAALAGTVKGPLLLTRPDSLPAEVAAEITRLQPKRVYVLGGTSAVSPAVFNAAKALTSMGIATRLEGPTRYETAIEIAKEVKAMRGVEYDGTAFVCTGENFPDALAASPIAAANGWPIYLTPPDHLRADVAAAMLTNIWGGNPTNHGYIIGGNTAISPAVETELNAAPFIVDGFMRIWGDTRYETAAEVAAIGFEGLGMLWSRPALATGENFPDALAGGVLQGSDYSVMLLTRGGTLSPEAAAMLAEYKDHIYEIRFLGGTSVLAPGVRTAARALLW